MSKLIRAISDNGGIIMYAIDSTGIVSEMEQLHHTSATVSAALGRLITGNVLMGATLKSEKDSLSLRVVGNGPAGNLFSVTDGGSVVKAYADNPKADLPLNTHGKLDVSGIVGATGTLYVVKDLGLKEPQVGMVPLTTGEIAEDITAYYAYSEQIPTVCALGVLVDTDLSIKKAGGYLLQLLPGATEDEIAMVEHNIAKVQSVTQHFSEEKTVHDLINVVMNGFNPNILDEQTIEYTCDCEKERFARSLIALGREELESIRDDGDDIEIKCQFCDKVYHFSACELLQQLKEI